MLMIEKLKLGPVGDRNFLNKLVPTLVWSFLLGSCCFAFGGLGIGDVSKFLTVQNDEKVPLSLLIDEFRTYDLYRNEGKKAHVTLLGCVSSPGLYGLKEGFKLTDLLKNRIIPPDKHLVYSFVSGIEIYRKGILVTVGLNDEEGKSFGLKDGDVIRVKAILL